MSAAIGDNYLSESDLNEILAGLNDELEELKSDYTVVEIGGHTYYTQS